MEEGDVQVLCALAGSLVDEAYSLLVAFGQGVAHAVFDAEGHVVYSVVAFVEPLLDGAFGRGGLQQFEFHLAALQEGGLHFLVGHLFNGVTLQPQDVLEIGQ